MKDLLIILFFLQVFASCSNHEKKLSRPIAFSTRHIPLPVDTTISSLAYFNGYFLLLEDNGKIIILDTLYKRVGSLEKKFLSLRTAFLFSYNDTLIIGTKNRLYYLSDNFSPIEYKTKKRMYVNVMFEDSAYLIYGCCAGEWGGAIFFLNKQTNKTYSYFATCPNQVLRFGKDYVVCNNLAHLSDHMSFLIVKDPTSLYEIKEEGLKNHCNWYATIDSLKDDWQISKVGNVRFYEKYDIMSLITFSFRDSLYSILSAPKKILLGIHRGDTIIVKDTLLSQQIFFHETQVVDAGNKKICLYKLTEGSPFAAYWVRGNNTGLIVVGENNIDFLEQQKPK